MSEAFYLSENENELKWAVFENDLFLALYEWWLIFENVLISIFETVPISVAPDRGSRTYWNWADFGYAKNWNWGSFSF